MAKSLETTGIERFFDEDKVIVSKTDLKGRILYANRTFLDIAGYSEKEVLGQPHSLIRHPDMPRCVFKLLWNTIQEGKEIFAYVINRTKNGDHYWVLAHVTPSRNEAGEIVGYHSNRRTPDRAILETQIIPLYRMLLEEEAKHANRKDGLDAGFQMLVDLLDGANLQYDEFIATLQPSKEIAQQQAAA